MDAHEEFETEHGDRFDTDGGHDRAERRHELKRTWKRLAARYCRLASARAPGWSLRDYERAFGAMIAAYNDWQDCH